MIKVDARACGVGKTRGHTNSIFADIKEAYDKSQLCLVVLPSIDIFDQYEEYINSFIDCPEDLVSINSRHNPTNDNTVDRLGVSTGLNARIVVITHKTFMLKKWHNGIKKNYKLFIDEAFDPFRSISYWDRKESKVIIPWDQIAARDNVGGEYEILTFEELALNASVLTNTNTTVKDLTDFNWKNYIHHADATSLFDPKPADRSLHIIQELKANIMQEWKSVRIACAAFEVTFMSEWLRSARIDFEVIPGNEFVKHAPLLTIHSPENKTDTTKKIQNSLTKVKQPNNWLHNGFQAFVESLSIIEPVLVLRNSTSVVKDLYGNETTVAFNAHGQNNFSHFNKISVEAAINLSPQMIQFHKEYHHGFDTFLARTGYDYYQIVMRTSLRQTPPMPCDMYCLDNRIALAFDNFFKLGKNACMLKFWDISEHKKQPLSGAERIRRHRAKLKEKQKP